MAVFFLFLRNVLLPIEILKIKILEHSDPPSQHFSVHKAFSHFYFCRGKVMLCHLAEWHIMTYDPVGKKRWEVFNPMNLSSLSRWCSILVQVVLLNYLGFFFLIKRVKRS